MSGGVDQEARRGELTLITPEAVALRFPLAEVFTRAAAFALDAILIVLITLAIVVPLGLATTFTGFLAPMGMALIGMFLLRNFYFTFFEVVWHGATPGKRWMGLRVVARDGSGLTVDAVVTRNLLRDLELFIPLIFLLAPEQVFGDVPWWSWMPAAVWVIFFALLPLLSRERLRAGDIAAGTVVIQVPKAELMVDEAARTSMLPGVSQEALRFTAAQLAHYGERELETLADLIRKIDEGKATLEDQAHIARTIAKKIGYEGPEPQREPTRFLSSFYKQQRAALEKQLLFGKRKASKLDR